LTSLTDKKGATTLLSTGYTLNAVGNRTAKSQGGVSENYSFDAIDQVTSVNYGGARNVGYDYDSVGNRTSVTDNAVTTNYSANNLNQYTSVSGGSWRMIGCR
jgi:YD repeat-containing protein